MFKVAFPWATTIDEENEKKYLKTLSSTSDDEIAGNVWVSPAYGMQLLCPISGKGFVTNPAIQHSSSPNNTRWNYGSELC